MIKIGTAGLLCHLWTDFPSTSSPRPSKVHVCVCVTGDVKPSPHTVGNIWDGFPRNVLACLWNACLPHPPFSLSLPLVVGEGVEVEDTNIHFLSTVLPPQGIVKISLKKSTLRKNLKN